MRNVLGFLYYGSCGIWILFLILALFSGGISNAFNDSGIPYLKGILAATFITWYILLGGHQKGEY